MPAGPATDPRKFKRWLIAIAVVYLVFPRDLLPDYIGRGLGFIDDVLVIGFLNYFYRKRLREYGSHAAGASSGPQQSQRNQAPPQPQSAAATDPYATLGISDSASQETIRSAYRARMNEYHPDKVAHLGDELQKLAHRKVLEIQEAYRRLRR